MFVSGWATTLVPWTVVWASEVTAFNPTRWLYG